MQARLCGWPSRRVGAKCPLMEDSPVNSEAPRRNIERLALAALVAGAVAIGFSGILARVSETGPSATGFWRMAPVLPVFWTWLWWQNRSAPGGRQVLSRHDRRILILAGLFFAIDIAFWHWSVQFTTIANANLLSNLNPVVVALASVLLFGERLGRRFYLGLALAMAGAALLSGASFESGGGRLKGDVLAVITAVFYGAYLLTVGRLRGRLDTATIMAWSTTVAAIFLLPLAWISGERLLPETMEGWAILLALAFSAQLLGQSLIAYAFAHLPAAFGALTLLIQPIVATIAAWILLGEYLTNLEIAGALVILIGILAARSGALPTTPSRQAPP